eukprot:gene13129-3919_t
MLPGIASKCLNCLFDSLETAAATARSGITVDSPPEFLGETGNVASCDEISLTLDYPESDPLSYVFNSEQAL